MADQHRSSTGTPAVRLLPGQARRIMANDLHTHATVIYNCMSQTLRFISSHMDNHPGCECTDLIDAALYAQSARDRLMQGLVQTFDDHIAAQNQQDVDDSSSDNSDSDSDDQVDIQGSTDGVVDNVD